MRKKNRTNSYLNPMACVVFIVFVVLGVAQGAIAAEWPTKPITIVVPSSPGGGIDTAARVTAPMIEKNLPRKGDVIVKNITGASHKIGLMEVLRAKPDGYTVNIIDPLDITVLQVGGALKGMDISKINWLGCVDSLTYCLVVGAKSGFKTPQDMKGKPVRFACSGASNTFSIAVLARALGVDARLIAFDGSSPGAIAAMQGDVDAIFNSWASQQRFVRASEGKLVPMFLCEKTPEVKDIPTAKELGVTFEEAMIPLLKYSHVLYGPPNLPPEVRKAWDDTLNRTFKDPEWAARMNKAGFTPAGFTGEKMATFIKEGFQATEKYKDIVAQIGVK